MHKKLSNYLLKNTPEQKLKRYKQINYAIREIDNLFRCNVIMDAELVTAIQELQSQKLISKKSENNRTKSFNQNKTIFIL